MKSTVLCLYLLAGALPTLHAADTLRWGAAPARAEFLSYDLRDAAAKGDREALKFFVPFQPQPLPPAQGLRYVGQLLDVPQYWNNRDLYLHIEHPGAPFTLYVNDRPAGAWDDRATPVDFLLSPFVEAGANALVLRLDDGRVAPAEASLTEPAGVPFEGSYVWSQPRLAIRDFTVRFAPDSTGTGQLDVCLIVANGYNYPETMAVGFDLYDPQGKLKEFNKQAVTVPGRSADTVAFRTPIYHTDAWRWTPRTPHLYRLTLFTEREGQMTEYVPLRIGYDRLPPRLDIRTDKPTEPLWERFKAGADQKSTLARMKAIRARGIDILWADGPQPGWFYDLCDREGFYVIDEANIRNAYRRSDRTVGGTPSNDPAQVEAYVDRVRRMVRRNRNHTSIIAWSLGHESGNGYALYKAYRWIKAQGDARPVYYDDADGEWNNDLGIPGLNP